MEFTTILKHINMKKLFTTLAVAMCATVGAMAQSAMYDEFPIIVSSDLTSNTIMSQYCWDSPFYTFAQPVTGVRVTIMQNVNGKTFANYPVVALAELTFYDKNYDNIDYTVANVKYNSLESGSSLGAVCDGDWNSDYYSAWSSAAATPDDYVYLDVTFPTPVSVFGITMVSADMSLAPSYVTITSNGVKYDGSDDTGGASGGNSGGTGSSDVEQKPIDVFSDSIFYVYLASGGIDAYPKNSIGEAYTDDAGLYIPLNSGELAAYANEQYDSCSWNTPQLPMLSAYKFSSKNNPTLSKDAEAVTISDTIRFTLNAIGKSLTAAFELSDNKAVAYIDTVLQKSNESRNRFADPVQYVVTYPGYNVVQNVKVSDEVWESPEIKVTEIALTEDMLYTNKPSTVGDDLANMLDNNPSTCFHTVYGAAYDATVMPYITITLDNPVEKLKFYYMSRTTGDYNPKALNLYVSDGTQWVLVKNFTYENDALPMETGAEYTSPVVDLGGSYKYLKLEQTASEYHNNHMVFAEFRLYDVAEMGEPEKVQDAVYENVKMPFGRIYTVDADWLTDGSNPVPRIDIVVEGGYEQIHSDKETYRDATFRITGYGVYDDFEAAVQIKGRGNTTWAYPKKPYRLKFAKKCQPFGLTKAKSWVLLANYQKGALMANAIAMKVGQLADVPGTNHMIPVELYMDGTYVGNYMFTEKVGFSDNSIDVDNDEGNGYMIELDTYYDEVYKFKTNNYKLPSNIKEPDLTDYTDDVAMQKFEAIINDFRAFEQAVFNGDTLGDKLDVEVCARFMLANDLILNQELGHPKSTYLWREDMTSPDSKITFGPLWDFDWAFGYEGTASYCDVSTSTSLLASSMSSDPGYKFFRDLMKHKEFKKYYYKVWKEFLDKGHIYEVMDFVADYYAFAETSFMNNYYLWGDGNNYASSIAKTQNWLKQRHDYLWSNIDKYDIEELLHATPGDVDCNDELTVHDVVITVAYLLGNTDESFNSVKADADNNGAINADDVSSVASQVAAADAVSPVYYHNTPVANALLSAQEVEITVNGSEDMLIAIEGLGTEQYSALQADVAVPTGVVLQGATAGNGAAGHNVVLNKLSDNNYRLLVYSDQNSAMSAQDAIVGLSLQVNEVLPEEERHIILSNILVADTDNVEQRVGDVTARFELSTGISAVEAALGIRGGEHLTISALASQKVHIYAVDGRMVRSLNISAGTTVVQLPAGVYVVQGQKVVIR